MCKHLLFLNIKRKHSSNISKILQTFVEYIHFKKKIIWIFMYTLLLNIREYPMIGIELIPF